MLQETRGRHGNLYIERCMESLVFLFQRNKEIFFQEERENSNPSLGKGINVRRKETAGKRAQATPTFKNRWIYSKK